MSNLWYSQVLKDIWRHFTTDVSYSGPYVETKNNGGERKVCMKWIQFRSWFRPTGAKVSSFIIQKFSRCFSLSFNVSVDVVRMFLSCFMIMIFPWLLKSWSCLLNCIRIFDVFSVVIEPNVEWCFWFTNVLNVLNVLLVWLSCWQQRQRVELHGTHFPYDD